MSKPKILVLDIETLPAISYHWRLFDENISLEQLIVPSRIFSVGCKWLGEKDSMYFETRLDEGAQLGREEMLSKVYALWYAADAVITYNGDKFDLPRLMGEFAEFDFRPPPPVTSIDMIKTTRKLGLQSNKLQYALSYFKLGAKVETGGFKLWREVYEGVRGAAKKMRTYCLGDVKGLERLYKKLRPYIKNHPHLGEDAEECGACQSRHVQKRGTRRTKAYVITRLQCKKCGSWSDGTRRKIK